MKLRKGLSVTMCKETTIVRLYKTNIIVKEGNCITLNTNGWRTRHTKNCMNDYLNPMGLYVYQENFTWYVSLDGNTISEFKDGLKLFI